VNNTRRSDQNLKVEKYEKSERQRVLRERIAHDVCMLDLLNGLSKDQDLTIQSEDPVYNDIIIVNIKVRTLNQNNAVIVIQEELDEYNFDKAKRKLQKFKDDGIVLPEFVEFEKMITEHEAIRKAARDNALTLSIYEKYFEVVLCGKIIMDSEYSTLKEDDTSYSFPCYIFDGKIRVWNIDLVVKDYRKKE
jgi:hypothetical protein